MITLERFSEDDERVSEDVLEVKEARDLAALLTKHADKIESSDKDDSSDDDDSDKDDSSDDDDSDKDDSSDDDDSIRTTRVKGRLWRRLVDLEKPGATSSGPRAWHVTA